MRIAATAIVLAGLSLTQAAAAPAPTERGRVVLNCRLDAARYLSACQVTRETPAGIGLGEFAVGWAAGKAMPPSASGGGESVIDLPLCFAVTRNPFQAKIDMTGACDALSSRRMTYAVRDVLSKPANIELVAPLTPGPSTVVTRQDLMATGANNLRDALARLPTGPVANGAVVGGAALVLPPGSGASLKSGDLVLMTCQVLSSGALAGCLVITPSVPPDLAKEAVDAAKTLRMRVAKAQGAPVLGSFAFGIRVKS